MSDRTDPEDVTMNDAPPSHQLEENENENENSQDQAEQGAEGGKEEEEEEEEEEAEPQRVRILPGSTDMSASFEFLDENHTLGNALRYIVMKNPDVQFCAYTIPHPSELKMNVRIQTYDGTAVAALQKGLKDLQDLSDTIAEEFIRAKEEFGRS